MAEAEQKRTEDEAGESAVAGVAAHDEAGVGAAAASQEEERAAPDEGGGTKGARGGAVAADEGGAGSPKHDAPDVAAARLGQGNPHGDDAGAERGHDAGEAGAHGDHGFAHVVPLPLLVGVWAALMALTALTVWAAGLGLGSRISFMVAMVIATVKAGLVMAIFMHLVWDKRVNVLAFCGSFLFVLLFIGLALNDKAEYEPDITAKAAEAAALAPAEAPAAKAAAKHAH